MNVADPRCTSYVRAPASSTDPRLTMVGAMSASASECIEATVAVLGSLQLDTVPVAWLDQVEE